ncbi:MAG: carbonic anhydrase [Candidatus Bathyarchaeia archaeon]|jgi:carbonic anhydrase
MPKRKVSRREFVAGTGLAAAGFMLGFTTRQLVPSTIIHQSIPATPSEALHLLLQGNQRFVSGSQIHPDQSVADRRAELATEQAPWAMVVGCIDSRVPPEVVFDLGLRDIFATRTAGQVIDNVVLGSIEYGVEEGVKLVMVLGHQNFGAVKATIKTMGSNGHVDGHIAALVDAIRPAVEQAKNLPGELLDNSVRTNIALQVELLKKNEIVSQAIDLGAINLVGARYDLRTGQVEVIT